MTTIPMPGTDGCAACAGLMIASPMARANAIHGSKARNMSLLLDLSSCDGEIAELGARDGAAFLSVTAAGRTAVGRLPAEKDDRLGSDALAPPDEAEALGGLGLDVDRCRGDAQVLSE